MGMSKKLDGGLILQSMKSRAPVLLALAAALLMAPTVNGQIYDYQSLPLLGNFDADLAARINSQNVKVAKIGADGLTAQQASDWFGAVVFDNLFADFEGLLAVTKTAELVSQASASTIVGNFALDPLHPDPTSTNPTEGFTQLAYIASGVTMSNDNLYPGSSSFKPAGNNVRSGLFTQPIARFAGVEDQRGETINVFQQDLEVFPETDKHIPYVTRFNNWGNTDLNTGPQQGFEYAFDTPDQLLSRGDFQAMISHYRMRGADAVVLFEPGVIGYTKEQMQEDATTGWNLLDPVLSMPTAKTVTDGTEGINEADGVVWSGSASDLSMVILLSNLDAIDHDVVLPDMIADLPLSDTDFGVAAGTHQLAEFINFKGIGWALVDTRVLIDDDQRGGIGIPEPASLIMLAIGSLLVGLPRSSRNR